MRFAAPALLLTFVFLASSCGGGGGGGAAPQSFNAGTPTGATGGNAPVADPVDDDVVNRDTPDNGRPFAFDASGMRAQAVAAVNGNPLEETLIQCTVTLRDGQECSLSELPLIGMQTASPSIDDVMNRVLVSHPWMGDRFREVLADMPADMLLMMRSVTAVVMSFDVRPSFYTTQTGAIYLDPATFWLTPEEQEVIDTAPDFRSEFGSDLQFTMLWRYVKDNERANRPPTTGTRTLADIRYRVASLLYHELAHAGDYFRPSRFSALDPSVPIYLAVQPPISSTSLTGTFPLTSSTMHDLAQVSFRGQTATAAQREMSPADVAFAFTGDFANDYYNYSTEREDFAMLFEEAMMYYSFDVDRDVGVTNLPEDGVCADYIVEFGQRNRILDASVAARAVFTVETILPDLAGEVELLLESAVGPIPMTPGLDWCSNQTLEAEGASSSRSSRAVEEPLPPERLVPYL